MNSPYLSPFSKAILTGLFAGIMATVLCLAYNIFYRDSTGYDQSDYINVSSLIFVVNLIFFVIGAIYYGFLRIAGSGEKIFIAVFLLLTIVLAYFGGRIHRFEVPQLNTEFHQLLLPIIIVMGLFAAIGIPFLYHSKKFEDAVL
jgi:hypothetical protein